MTVTNTVEHGCRRLDGAFNSAQRQYPNFDSGWALGLHTTLNKLTGSFERTTLGTLVYNMKYKSDASALSTLASLMVARIKERLAEFGLDSTFFSAVVPAPPSDLTRRLQPTVELAKRIAKELGIACDTDCIYKSASTTTMKSIDNYHDKVNLLRPALRSSDKRYAGKRVLVIDDIVDSGATLDCVAGALKEQGGVKNVYVCCATETFGKR